MDAIDIDLMRLEQGQQLEAMRQDCTRRFRFAHRFFARFPDSADKWYAAPIWWLI